MFMSTDGKGRNPHKRTTWKLVGNPGRELVANYSVSQKKIHPRGPDIFSFFFTNG